MVVTKTTLNTLSQQTSLHVFVSLSQTATRPVLPTGKRAQKYIYTHTQEQPPTMEPNTASSSSFDKETDDSIETSTSAMANGGEKEMAGTAREQEPTPTASASPHEPPLAPPVNESSTQNASEISSTTIDDPPAAPLSTKAAPPETEAPSKNDDDHHHRTSSSDDLLTMVTPNNEPSNSDEILQLQDDPELDQFMEEQASGNDDDENDEEESPQQDNDDLPNQQESMQESIQQESNAIDTVDLSATEPLPAASLESTETTASDNTTLPPRPAIHVPERKESNASLDLGSDDPSSNNAVDSFLQMADEANPIDLIDSDDDDDNDDNDDDTTTNELPPPPTTPSAAPMSTPASTPLPTLASPPSSAPKPFPIPKAIASSNSTAPPISSSSSFMLTGNTLSSNKRPRIETTNDPSRPTLSAHAVAALQHGPTHAAMQSYHHRNVHTPSWRMMMPTPNPPTRFNEATFLSKPHGFVPTWDRMLPPQSLSTTPPTPVMNQRQCFELSLLNVHEFTITGLPVYVTGPPTALQGLRRPLRKFGAKYTKGQWRIPLTVYQQVATYLQQRSHTTLQGISRDQLQMASIARTRQMETDSVTVHDLVHWGLPQRLATTLAPFQRTGVAFVRQRDGRALIADDMGLGKTIQGIASTALYRQDWPILVLTPSSARYHWQSEYLNWLGRKEDDDDDVLNQTLLEDHQVHVLASGKQALLPRVDTHVCICSYGLVTTLAESGRLEPGMFPTVLVDESHMLKNKSSKRTTCLLPILHQARRCILLSGTPALARPAELWPQLSVLDDTYTEAQYMDRYVRHNSKQRRAELHAMLTGTIMIRRLKNDILKDMPRKLRQRAALHLVPAGAVRYEFRQLLEQLREGKGQLGKLARAHHAEEKESNDFDVDALQGNAMPQQSLGLTSSRGPAYERACHEIQAQAQREYQQGRTQIETTMQSQYFFMAEDEQAQHRSRMIQELKEQVQANMNVRMKHLEENGVPEEKPIEDPEEKRANVLSRLYELTGKVKIPLMVDLLQRWINDPTKGKLCIFAHHLSVLNSVAEQANLSNYIRIDGSTTPKNRHKQIQDFQTDPSVRIALLGITAAGVAVTLTASSTVWFAELFWTPAIMVQAEDRCHRIGQQAQVKCVYFCAKGTIDDILWRLLAKKFRDLGEFVEGKDRLKMVVDKNYTKVAELHAMFNSDFDEDEDELAGDSDDSEDEDMELDSDLVHDIEKLGEEEVKMMRQGNDDNGEGGGGVASTSPVPQGQSQEDAIALSDDDDVGNKKPQAAAAPTQQRQQQNQGPRFENFVFYNMVFEGPSLGMEIALFRGRIVISRILQERIDLVGVDGRPRVGAILVAVKGRTLPVVHSLQQIIPLIRTALQARSADMTFAEEDHFSALYAHHLEREKTRRREQRRAEAKAEAPKASGIIEIVSDEEK